MGQVYKFGGSTIKSAQALMRITDIISETKNLSFVVLSATCNTTNELEDISNKNSSELVEVLINKHLKLAEELEISSQVSLNIASIKAELLGYLTTEHSVKRMDSIYSVGERLSSILLYFLLQKVGQNVVLLDAREIIKTNSEFSSAGPILFDIRNNVQALCPNTTYITQGFIGSNYLGETTTLGREGSDYTASLLAWARGSKSMTVWKDVAGVYETDPKIYADVQLLPKLSYEQAELLTNYGSKILYARTMSPLKDKGIDLYVRGLQSESAGTHICKEAGRFLSLTVLTFETMSHISILGDNFFDEKLFNSASKVLQQANITYEIYEFSNKVITYSINKQSLKNCTKLLGLHLFGKHN